MSLGQARKKWQQISGRNTNNAHPSVKLSFIKVSGFNLKGNTLQWHLMFYYKTHIGLMQV